VHVDATMARELPKRRDDGDACDEVLQTTVVAGAPLAPMAA